MNIFLIGFMGSGKSTIAKALNKHYGMQVLEMDEMLEKQEGMCISDIFAEKGEDYFRELETAFLANMCGQQGAVVSCGGGVPLREQNVIEMRKNGIVIWLQASPETILNRVKENDDRPLLRGNKNVTFISEMMEKRREKYENASDFVVKTDGKSSREIADEIMKKVKGE